GSNSCKTAFTAVNVDFENMKQQFIWSLTMSLISGSSSSAAAVTYPNLTEFFEFLGVDIEISDMSLSVSLDQGRGCKWGTRNGFSSLFAQKKNFLSPYFWQMIREISRFKQDVNSYLEALDNHPDIYRSESLGQFIKSLGYSELFQKAYLIPICASIWSYPIAGVSSFSAYYVLSFCRDHHLLQLFDLPQLLTVRWRSHTYVNKVKEEFEKRGCQIRTGCEVNSVTTNGEGQSWFYLWLLAGARCAVSFIIIVYRHNSGVKIELCLSMEKASINCIVLPLHSEELLMILTVKERAFAGCTIACKDGGKEVFDGCIMTAHAPDTLKMLGKAATYDETRILGALHSNGALGKHPTFTSVVSARGAGMAPDSALSCHHSLGQGRDWHPVLRFSINLGDSKLPYLVTLDHPHTPEHMLFKWKTSHPVPSVAASKALRELDQIQGKRRIWFCGTYQGYGFYEDGLKAGVSAADGMLRRSCHILGNPENMAPTWLETGACLVVTRFFRSFIQTGCIILLEEGGTIFTFQGTERKYSLKVFLRVHNAQFYWKVATLADIGIADAFIHGDISFVDKDEGLLNLFMIYVANIDLKACVKRSWWTPLLALSSAKYFIGHVSNENTLTQARRNISRHYDLVNQRPKNVVDVKDH
ncbi:cfs1-like protein, partial [Datura stramonium]|nr:cfs1-like protein [Datura stramonium]